jgi:hypothetical protein
MLVVTFQNTSDLAPVSNYDYEVWVTTVEGGKKVLVKGKIDGHIRAEGWEKLVDKLTRLHPPQPAW